MESENASFGIRLSESSTLKTVNDSGGLHSIGRSEATQKELKDTNHLLAQHANIKEKPQTKETTRSIMMKRTQTTTIVLRIRPEPDCSMRER